MSISLYTQDYSEKSFVLLGNDTKTFKEEIKNLGGKWNSSLSKNGEKFSGWIFPSTKKNIVSRWINDKNIKKDSPTTESKVVTPQLITSVETVKELNINDIFLYLKKIDAKLDYLINSQSHKKDVNNKVTSETKTKEELEKVPKKSYKGDEEDYEDEEEIVYPRKKLLK